VTVVAGHPFPRRLFRRRRTEADPRLPALACLTDTDVMLRLFRGGVVAGVWEVIELPKLLLEMVRSVALTDGAGESSAEVDDSRRILWSQLHRVESSYAGDPRLDQALAELFAGWDRYRTAVTAVLGGPGHSSGGAATGTPRTHPMLVAPYLRRALPCVGLVDAAADAFATSVR
jgi:hypothetical protein